jgi:hypothetical protein
VDDVGTAANVDARAEPRISQRASDAVARQVHFHDPNAPRADRVVPSAFVAVRDEQDRLLLVRRRDSGKCELPGGRVDVGESAVDAAVRETIEEAGVRVQIEAWSACSPILRISCGPPAVRYASSSWCASGPVPFGAGLAPTVTRQSMPPGSVLRKSRPSIWNPRWVLGSSRSCPGTPNHVCAEEREGHPDRAMSARPRERRVGSRRQRVGWPAIGNIRVLEAQTRWLLPATRSG